ncbi:MAG: transcriptional regulator [Proteobacteria bacterium]|nr:transcriptional regulator [Pseudomonadota bacterium]
MKSPATQKKHSRNKIAEGENDTSFRSVCPVARTLDVLGDKWTLVIMRDALIFGARTYADFAGQPECIPSNLLAQRLKKLIRFGLLEKMPYQTNPPRLNDAPTEQGEALRPLQQEARKFGETYLADS